MTEIEKMQKQHQEVIEACRDELAMQMDPDAFKPPTMTVTLHASSREMARRKEKAIETANRLMRSILIVLDQEYAVYYGGKQIAQA